MMFLLPAGGVIDRRFGILASPQHRGVPEGIKAGMPWAGDLGCIHGPHYVKRFDLRATRYWLKAVEPYKKTCLFLTVPDFVGNARATLDAYGEYAWLGQWPLAFVAQDGQETLPLPYSAALFVGGSTAWKMSDACMSVIQRAQRQYKHIHIGRVNWWRRYEHFRGLEGAEEFTCDGTRQRFEGIERTRAAWANYQGRDYQTRLPVFGGYRSVQPGGE